MTLKSMLIAPPDGSRCGGGFCRHDAKCRKTNCAGHPSQTDENCGDEAADPLLVPGYYWPITSNASTDTEDVRGGMRLATWVALAVLTPFTAWLVWSGWQMWPSFVVSLQSIGIPVF